MRISPAACLGNSRGYRRQRTAALRFHVAIDAPRWWFHRFTVDAPCLASRMANHRFIVDALSTSYMNTVTSRGHNASHNVLAMNIQPRPTILRRHSSASVTTSPHVPLYVQKVHSKAASSSQVSSGQKCLNLGECKAVHHSAQAKLKHTGTQCYHRVASRTSGAQVVMSFSRSTQCTVPKISKSTQLADMSWASASASNPRRRTTIVQEYPVTSALNPTVPVQEEGCQNGTVLASHMQQSADKATCNYISFRGGTKTYTRPSKLRIDSGPDA